MSLSICTFLRVSFKTASSHSCSALDESSLIKIIVQAKREVDEAARALGSYIREKNSERQKEGGTSPKQSTSSQGGTSSRECDVPEARS